MTENTPEPFQDVSSGEPPVRGFLHRSASPAEDVLLLTHGAGGTCEAPLLVLLATSFAAAGLNVLRYDLPFRQRRPNGPPRPGDAEADREGICRAITLAKQKFGGALFLGGHSYGGRQSSMLAASDSKLANGLLLTSYPLHPPGRPAQQRTSHFPDLRIPALFVHGKKDAFASTEELQAALKLIPAPTRLISLEGTGHELLNKRNRDELPAMVIEAFKSFFG